MNKEFVKFSELETYDLFWYWGTTHEVRPGTKPELYIKVPYIGDADIVCYNGVCVDNDSDLIGEFAYFIDLDKLTRTNI